MRPLTSVSHTSMNRLLDLTVTEATALRGVNPGVSGSVTLTPSSRAAVRVSATARLP